MATITLNTNDTTTNNDDTLESVDAGTSAVGINGDNVNFINLDGGIVRAVQGEGVQARGANATIENRLGGLFESETSEPIIDSTGDAAGVTLRNFGEISGRVILSTGDDSYLQAGTWGVPLNPDGTIIEGLTAVGLSGGDDRMTVDYSTFEFDFRGGAQSTAETRIGVFGGEGEDIFTVDNLDGTFQYFQVGEFETLELKASNGAVTTIIDASSSDFFYTDRDGDLITNEIAKIEVLAGVTAVLRGIELLGTSVTGDEGDNSVSLAKNSTVGDIDLGGGNDSFTAAAGSTHGTVLGGAGNDTLTSETESGATLNGGVGNDVLVGGAGADTLTGGAGADIFRGTLESFDGDTITDLSSEDSLDISGVYYLRESNTPQTATFVTNDDDDDFSLTIDSDLSSAGFITTGQAAGETSSRIIADLADLDEGVALADAQVNGVAVDEYLSSDTATDFRVSLREADITADFDNSLGVYEVRGDGTIADVRLLSLNVKDGGTFNVQDLDDGSTLGFFIVQDGAASLTDGAVLDIDVSSGDAVLEVDGAESDLTIFLSHDADLNVDNSEHVVSGAAEDGSGALAMGFEDLVRTANSDDDFQDVVFQVDALLPPDPVA
jgi:hypothetical protein|tara:strand:+ start:13750 stop:15573 length:1824 start_codon:yes stop_codon:yes gene_type:complete